MIKYLILALILWNGIVFIMYGIDKKRAVKNRWRIPERVLLWSAFLVGSAGAFAGMEVFHHKTKHNAFRFGIPAMLALHLALVAYLTFRH